MRQKIVLRSATSPSARRSPGSSSPVITPAPAGTPTEVATAVTVSGASPEISFRIDLL